MYFAHIIKNIIVLSSLLITHQQYPSQNSFIEVKIKLKIEGGREISHWRPGLRDDKEIVLKVDENNTLKEILNEAVQAARLQKKEINIGTCFYKDKQGIEWPLREWGYAKFKNLDLQRNIIKLNVICSSYFK